MPHVDLINLKSALDHIAVPTPEEKALINLVSGYQPDVHNSPLFDWNVGQLSELLQYFADKQILGYSTVQSILCSISHIFTNKDKLEEVQAHVYSIPEWFWHTHLRSFGIKR